MSYKDISLICIQCGIEFIFTVGEQEFFDEKGFTEKPKRCKSCRSERKRRTSQKRGDGIYRSPAFEGSAPAHQKIRSGRPKRGQNRRRGEYRSPGFRESDKINPAKEYRSPAFREQAGIVPDDEYRAPGSKEHANIKVDEEYRAPGFKEHADIKVDEEYRSPGFQDIREKYKDEKPMFSIICAACGEEASVPFLPEEREQHFCQECYREKREAETSTETEEPNPED